MKEIKAVLFDLDGVILDTEDLYTEFWSVLGQKVFGDAAVASRIKGMALHEVIALFAPGDPVLASEITRAIDDYEASITYNYIPGALAFISSLRQNGIMTAIVTSSTPVKMEQVYAQLPELREEFNVTITSRDVTRSKPDPEPYLNAMKALGVQPWECVVFEDSFNGLKSARSSGAFVAGLATTNPAEAISYLCDMVIADFTEIGVGFIDSISSGSK